MDNKFYIACSDITDFTCDVIVLKYAQEFYGADELVANLLTHNTPNSPEISPMPGKYVLLPSKGKIRSKGIRSRILLQSGRSCKSSQIAFTWQAAETGPRHEDRKPATN